MGHWPIEATLVPSRPRVAGLVEPELAAAVVPGASSVVTTVHPMGSDRVTQQRIGRTLGELDQKVVVLNFDEKGVLKSIGNVDQDAALPVTMIARTTASPGTEASFMQQLLGNIGKFNAGGTSVAPGGGAPSTGRGL